MSDNSAKLIACIVPKGVAMGVVEALKTEKGIITANVKSARGAGKLTPLAYRGIGGQTEKEILLVPVEAQLADEIFEFIYEKAEINKPHGGLMYQGSLARLSLYTLPEIPEET